MSYDTIRPTGAVRAIVGAMVSVVFVVVSAAPAAAHTSLKASSPKDGGKIGVAPDELVLEFTYPILTVGYRIVVQGPDGRQYQGKAPQIADNKLSQPLKPLGPPGEYRVDFRVVAYDGHPLTSGMRFTLTKPGPAAGGAKALAQPPRLAPVSDTVHDAPSWVSWAGGALTALLVFFGVLFGWRVTRGLD
jgi:methionine-rich copper-binding protein CopC